MFAKSHRVGVWVGIVMLWVSVASLAENEGKIALVMKALSNPFFIKMRDGAMEYAEKSDIQVEVYGIERETEVERQIGIIENLIAREYGAIVIAPADSKKLIPVCKKALAKGVVVINIDNPFHAETLKEYGISIPFVGSDNRAGAALVGNYLKRKLGNAGNVVILEGIRGVENAELRKQGSGNVLELEGIPGTSAAYERGTGFNEVIGQHPGIQIIARDVADFDREKARSVMTRLLNNGLVVDAVFAHNDEMMLGVIAAYESSKMKPPSVLVGFDATTEALKTIKDHRLTATIAQQPEAMGWQAVSAATQVFQQVALPSVVFVNLELVEAE